MGAAPGAVGLTAAGTIRLPHGDFMLDSCVNPWHGVDMDTVGGVAR